MHDVLSQWRLKKHVGFFISQVMAVVIYQCIKCIYLPNIQHMPQLSVYHVIDYNMDMRHSKIGRAPILFAHLVWNRKAKCHFNIVMFNKAVHI